MFPLCCTHGTFNLILGPSSLCTNLLPRPKAGLGFCEPLEASGQEALACTGSYREQTVMLILCIGFVVVVVFQILFCLFVFGGGNSPS